MKLPGAIERLLFVPCFLVPLELVFSVSPIKTTKKHLDSSFFLIVSKKGVFQKAQKSVPVDSIGLNDQIRTLFGLCSRCSRFCSGRWCLYLLDLVYKLEQNITFTGIDTCEITVYTVFGSAVFV
jgi:hypothetical protein